jgi:hypothetical protein
MVQNERNDFSKFEENELKSSEQRTVFGGVIPPKGNGTPITRTGTKPPKVPLSTTNNGDPRPTDPVEDIGMFPAP